MRDSSSMLQTICRIKNNKVGVLHAGTILATLIKIVVMKTGPIILIDDDPDDKDVFIDILKELNVANKVIWFQNCDDAF
jgi:hypothetical protein